MDVLTDDHEREQVVRKWWSDNWKSLALGIVIALGGMIGYRQYQNYQHDAAAKKAFELSTIQTKLSLKQENAVAQAESFIKEHEDLYGSLLSLDLAAMNSAAGEYEKALDNAVFAVKNGGELVAPNAKFVQAHVLAQMKKFDEAVSLLESVETRAYAVEKYETLGDVYYFKGDMDKAHDAYLKALEVCEQNKIAINPLLQMKADNLIHEGDTPAYKRAQVLAEEISKSAAEIKK